MIPHLTESLEKFLYEKAKAGELYAGFVPRHPTIHHDCAPDKLYNVFDIIDSLANGVGESGRELAEYNVMHLRKMVIRKIASDFDAWFYMSGLPLGDWREYAITYAKKYMMV